MPIFIIRNSLEVYCVLIFVIWLKDLTAPTLWSLRIPKIKFCYDLEFFSICYKNKRYKVLGWVQDDLITFGWILFFRVFRSELLTCIKLYINLFWFSIIRVFLSCLLTFELWTYLWQPHLFYIVFIMEFFYRRFYVFCLLLQLFYVHTVFRFPFYEFIYGLPLKFFSGVSQSSYVLLYLEQYYIWTTIFFQRYNRYES